MEATPLARVFVYEDRGNRLELADPSPEMLPEDVLNFYSSTYPTFTTAKLQGPFWDNGKEEYRIMSVLGTKG